MTIATVPHQLLVLLGEAYTLRRKSVAAGANAWTDGAPTVTYYPQRGNQRLSEPDAVAGNVRDPHGRIVLSPNFTAPIVGDQVAPGTHVSDAGVEWREIVHVDSPRVGGVISRHVVQYRK